MERSSRPAGKRAETGEPAIDRLFEGAADPDAGHLDGPAGAPPAAQDAPDATRS